MAANSGAATISEETATYAATTSNANPNIESRNFL